MLSTRNSNVSPAPRADESLRIDRPSHLPAGVLVVDDHPAVRAGLERLFAAEAALNPVASAATGSRAIARAVRLRPAVAVVDYRLPDRDGLSLTLELKRLPHPPGVVIYSAFAAGERAMPRLSAPALSAVATQLGAEDKLIVAMLLSGASWEGVAQKLGIGADWLEIRRWAIVQQLLAPSRQSSRERRIAYG